ncbi:hypothetical protein MH117_09620 [Paenibacillus sp. ACRRX]|uniref:hypothetical protein n=1 Tax=Paenibacillus sp. ACRRX TaxID=2918206 RepID=UPI001EF5A856|nr:hypothetical protein [Paenibacillus sp. ACRRX]MCG7407681.1 hypothetical protein [Paenibacillus sp. ACRRX]
MKKFISGIVVGALLFGGTSIFADSIKNLVGEKVTGIYVVEQGGKKIADGAIINGSAYVPVRAIADATGTPLTVKGKKITLSGKTVLNEGNALSEEALALTNKIAKLRGDISSIKVNITAENVSIKTYVDAITEEKAREEKIPGRLSGLEENLSKSRKVVADYQTQIDVAEAEIIRIQAEIDTSK